MILNQTLDPKIENEKKKKQELLRKSFLNSPNAQTTDRYPINNQVNFSNTGKLETFANQQNPPVKPIQQQQPLTQPKTPSLYNIQNPNQQQSIQPQQNNINLGFAQPKQDVLKQGSEQVLQNAQQQAMQGFQTNTGNLVTQQTDKLLQNPNQSFNYDSYRQNLEDRLRRERAGELDALRGQTGMTSNTAKTLQNLLGFQLKSSQDINESLSDYDLARNEQERQNLINALTQGRETMQSQQDVYNTNLQGKLNTAKTGLDFSKLEQEKEAQQKQMDFQEKMKLLDIDAQEKMINLQGNIDKGMLISKQDYDSAQSALDRELQKYVSSGDWENAQKIQDLKNQNDLVLQQQQIQAQENMALLDRDTQEMMLKLQGEIDQGMLLSRQDYESTQNALDRDLQKYKSAGDWANAEKIQKMKDQNDLLMQQQQIEAQQNMQLLDIDAQERMMRLQGDIDKGMLLTTQDFEAIQNDLDRNLQEFVAKGDWENVQKIEEMRQQNQMQMQKAKQEWSTAERQATQSWQTGERLSEQEFNKAIQYIDQQNALALQNNDIEAQKYLAEKQQELQLQMQMQDFTQQEKMFELNKMAEESFKNMDYQNAIKMKEMEFEQQFKMLDADHTFQESMAMLKDSMQQNYMQMQQEFDKEKLAIQQSNDINKAEKLAELEMNQKKFELDWQEKMTNKQMEMQKQQFEKNYLLDQAKLKLQQAGFDQDKLMQQYQALMASGKEEEANQLLANSLKESDPELAEKIMNPDPMQWKKNLDMDMKIAQYQFAQTHPDSAKYDADGNFMGLTEEGKKQYNDFVNETMFGQPQDVNGVKLQAIKNGELSTAELSDPESILYKSALNDPATVPFTGHVFNNNGNNTFSEINYAGVGGFIKVEDSLYQVTSSANGIYSILDPVTGKTYNIGGNDNFDDIKIKLGLKSPKVQIPFEPVNDGDNTGNLKNRPDFGEV